MRSRFRIWLIFFILGEGEEVNSEIMDVYKEWKNSGSTDRDDFLMSIIPLGGVYVPKVL